MLIDMETVRTAAKNNAATPCYPANAANEKHGEISKISNVSSVSKVATGFANGCQATEISSVSRISNVSKVAGGSNALPPDPGMAQLLALADRYCTAIQASDKARADWHSDVQATPPGDRDGLAAYLRGKLAKLAPTPLAMRPKAAPPALAKPVPKFSQEAPWRAADNAFQAHYWQCPQCKTGGRTRGPLCPQA